MRERRVDMKEGEMKVLKVTMGKKIKRKMERSCKGSGCLTGLLRSQDDTDLFR